MDEPYEDVPSIASVVYSSTINQHFSGEENDLLVNNTATEDSR